MNPPEVQRQTNKQIRIMIVGGTGLLGYHAVQEGIKRGHTVSVIAIRDIEPGSWYPDGVKIIYGNVFDMEEEELRKHFLGYDAMVYALGPDDRITPPAPAYNFFYLRLVSACVKTVTAARKAGLKRCVILNSYFSYFDRKWPELKLSKHHPYIRCRVEQAREAIAAGGDGMAVSVLELPYIFGSMPQRVPLWKEVLYDRIAGRKAVLFPSGGTNMISSLHVGEAIIGAAERGRHAARYLVGDENHTFREMVEMMASAAGWRIRVISMPRFMATAAGIFLKAGMHRKHLEGGLDPVQLMRCILTRKLYFDPAESSAELGYYRGGLYAAMEDTVRACAAVADR